MSEFETRYPLKQNPEWLASNGEYIIWGKRVPEINESIPSRLEYAHIMLKPEALAAFQQNPRLDVSSRITELAISAGMLASDWEYFQLSGEEIKLIYSKQINNGWITEERVASFLSNPTAHLILIGPYSRTVAAIIRGRVACRGGEHCFTRFLPQDELIIPNIIKNCPAEELPEKAWAMGCGVRQEMINSGILRPERQSSNDTQWNMVHASDSGDNYTPDFVRLMNSLPSTRFSPFPIFNKGS